MAVAFYQCPEKVEQYNCDKCNRHEVENPEFRNCALVYNGGQYPNESFEDDIPWLDRVFRRCPKSLFLNDSRVFDILTLSTWVQDTGNLPEEGGLLDQDNELMNYLYLVSSENKRISNERLKDGNETAFNR